LGALTKEIAIPLAPLLVGAFELSRLTRRKGRAIYFAEASGLLAAIGLRLAFAPAWHAHHQPLGMSGAVGTRLAALARSTAAVMLPVKQTICDAFPVTHLSQPTAIAGGIVLCGLAYGAYRRRGPALMLALTVLPLLQIVPVMRWWSPHYLYL